MGETRRSRDIRKKFITPLTDLLSQLNHLCDDWEESYHEHRLSRADLHVNEQMAVRALSVLQKFCRDIQGKYESALAGVYRYRDSEYLPKKNTADEDIGPDSLCPDEVIYSDIMQNNRSKKKTSKNSAEINDPNAFSSPEASSSKRKKKVSPEDI